MAIICIRTVFISLALGFTVISTVLGAALKEESQDQVTNASSDEPDLYRDKCVKGSCQWECNDKSDSCWVAGFYIDEHNEHQSYYVSCRSDQDCTTKIKGMRKAECRSPWGGYRGVSDLKCIKDDMDRFSAEEAKNNAQGVREWEAQQKAEEDRGKKIEEKLGPAALEDIAARLVGGGPRNEEWLARARQAMRNTAQKLEDKDLDLEPEALKERLFDGAKEHMAEAGLVTILSAMEGDSPV